MKLGLSRRMKDFLAYLDKTTANRWKEYWPVEEVTAKALVARGMIEKREGLHHREARWAPHLVRKPV